MTYTKTDWTNSKAVTVAKMNNLETQYDEAIEQCLVIEAWAAVDGEEPDQVDSTFGPCIEFMDGLTRSIRACERWPDWSTPKGLALEVKAAADTSYAGNFRIRIGYRINGGAETTVDTTVSALASSTAITTVNLGTIIASGGVVAGDLVTLRISRLGADAADTHTGKLRLYQVRLKKV